jgi:hypothetical protein
VVPNPARREGHRVRCSNVSFGSQLVVSASRWLLVYQIRGGVSNEGSAKLLGSKNRSSMSMNEMA